MVREIGTFVAPGCQHWKASSSQPSIRRMLYKEFFEGNFDMRKKADNIDIGACGCFVVVSVGMRCMRKSC